MYVIMFVPRPFTVHNAFPCFMDELKLLLLLLFEQVFDKCYLGCKQDMDEDSMFCGQMSSVFLFSEALSAHQVASIYSLGPGYKVCIMWGPERSPGRFYLQSRARLQGMCHVRPWALSRSLLSTVWGLATRYVSCEALSAQQVASIYSLGPGYKVCIMWGPERSAGRFYLQSRAWLQGMYHVMPWALSRSLLSTV